MLSYLASLRRYCFINSRESTWDAAARHARALWPVNEIVLESLVLRGRSNDQIANQYGVSPEQVSGLRQAYEL